MTSRALELLGRISDAASAADKAAKAARLKDSGGRARCKGGGDPAGLDLPHQPGGVGLSRRLWRCRGLEECYL
jgi:hypothetical protein